MSDFISPDPNERFKNQNALPIVETQSSAKKIFSTLIMLTALGGLGVLGWFAYEEGKTPAELASLPYIEAEKTPFKVKPANPEGLIIPDRDKQIYNTVSSKTLEKGEEKVNVMPAPEEPVKLEKLAEVPAPFMTEDVEAAFADEENVAEEKVAEVAIEEPKEEVKPVVEKIVTTIEKEVKKAEVKEKAGLKIIRLTKIPSKPVVKVVKTTAEPKKTATATNKIPLKPRHETQEVEKIATAEKIKEPEKIEQVKSAPAKAEDSGYRIQLGSYRSTGSLKRGWRSLQETFPEMLSGLRYSIKSVDIADKGVFYRLYAGPLDNELEASMVCKRLNAKKQGCLLVR